jgi:hypothetical protein
MLVVTEDGKPGGYKLEKQIVVIIFISKSDRSVFSQARRVKGCGGHKNQAVPAVLHRAGRWRAFSPVWRKSAASQQLGDLEPGTGGE